MNLQQKVDAYLKSQRFLLSAGNLSLLRASWIHREPRACRGH